MAEVAVRCPQCRSEAVVKYGKTSKGKERFRCQQREPCGRTFLQAYAYSGCVPTVKQRIVGMTPNGSGIRGILRVCYRQRAYGALKSVRDGVVPVRGD
jgi:transposase-like protein